MFPGALYGVGMDVLPLLGGVMDVTLREEIFVVHREMTKTRLADADVSLPTVRVDL